MKTYKVYTHINKINGKQYIGITSTDVKTRWKDGQGYNTQTVFYRAILKYGWDNFDHKILYDNLSYEEAIQKERECIIKYKTWVEFNDSQGYNMSLTNTGPTTKKVQQYTLEGVFVREYNSAFDAVKENNWQEASYHNIQSVCNQVKKYKSYQGFLWKYSNDVRNINEWIKRYKITDNKQKKTVYQYDLNDNFIGKYTSVGMAAKTLNLIQQNISKVATGKRKTCGGFKWSYIPLNEEDEFKDFTVYDK